MVKTNKNLLIVLSEKIKCEYLSDLHSFYYRTQLISILGEMNAEDYPTEEWREATAYIINESTDLKGQEKIRDYLVSVLRRKGLDA